MKMIEQSKLDQVSGAGIPMPTPHLNGPAVTKETSDFYMENGPMAVGKGVGAVVGAVTGVIGGPVGIVIGGAIGAIAGDKVAEAIKPQN